MAKTLHRATDDPQAARPIYELLGLLEDPEFHLRLETIYAEWQKREARRKKAIWDAQNKASQ